MNMRILRPSRRKPEVGDTFAYQMPDNLYRFGRVIRTDARIGGFDNCILVYFYTPSSVSLEEVPALSTSALLIPPKATNAQPWARGYFQFVRNDRLIRSDILAQHCFWDAAFKCYRDADGTILQMRSEPCGFFGLSSYRTIDDELSGTLGFPVAE